MPKVKQRKKSSTRKATGAATGNRASTQVASSGATATGTRSATATRRNSLLSPRTQGVQSLVFPAMVALGCWGMAVSFAFFYNDPNHFLYGGMAALLALLWTFSFAVRVRKMMQQRSSTSR
ncbi:MAG TPA: hypothetical protein VFQ30_19675 [Ktedonobacteraceae bacterium]|nr:hypothetical protein [Ktedonobacteraceae bacterium]